MRLLSYTQCALCGVLLFLEGVCVCVLPVQQPCDLQQELVGHTALGCQVGVGSPPLLWLLHQLKRQLSTELHEAPRAEKEWRGKRKGQTQLGFLVLSLIFHESVRKTELNKTYSIRFPTAKCKNPS